VKHEIGVDRRAAGRDGLVDRLEKLPRLAEILSSRWEEPHFNHQTVLSR
jgi:hypothetical protein